MWLRYGCVRWVNHERREYSVSVLWLLHQAGENKCVCSSYDSLSFLSASLIVPCLGLVKSVNSETVCNVHI